MKSLKANERFYLDRLDKFYTKKETVEKCVSILDLDKYEVIIDPCAGSGAFLEFLPEHKTVSLDIEPDISSIAKMDFFDFTPALINKYLVIGNPPFGKNSSLAKRFFKHAASFSNTIAFIVPRTFRKVSTTNQLCLHYHKVQEIVLPDDAFELPDGTPYSVPSVFQVWERRKMEREKIILPSKHADFKILSAEDYDIDPLVSITVKLEEEEHTIEAEDYDIDPLVSITVKLEEEEHTFESDIEEWEKYKATQKALPSYLFSSYKTVRVKRNIDWKIKPDFVIRRAGSQAGRVDKNYEKKALEGNYFIKAYNNKVLDIFQKMWDTEWSDKVDKEKLGVKWDTAGQACISKGELIQQYEKTKEEMNERK